MTNAPEHFNLDVRIRERMLKKQTITAAGVEAHLAALKDAEGESVGIELEQPALAKPPVVVAPVVQPMQAPRSTAGTDLPTPPPGLIKDSPTPPYTPMVIESLPQQSPVNGAELAAPDLAASSEEVDEADDSDEASTEAADDSAEAVDEASPSTVVSNGVQPAGDASAIDDEWGNS